MKINYNNQIIVGKIKIISGTPYIVVNIGGTLEKHNKINWIGQLKLEIMQGIGKYLTVCEARDFIKKHE